VKPINENQKAEFAEVIGEMKNQLVYFQELGFDALETSFTRTEFIAARSVRMEPEKRVPTPEAPPTAIVSREPLRPTIVPRSEILASSRLSNRLSQIDEGSEPSILKSVVMISKDEKEIASPLLGDFAPKLEPSSETLSDIREDVGDCKLCPLCEGRTQIVHSEGDAKARLMFVGEAPGADEDAQGRPFVGRAGQLLTKIIEAIGLKREDVFIGNINRCRPPGNRQPTLIEAQTCRPYLLREIAVVRPKIIVVMGNTACQNLLETKVGISKLRGSFHDYFGVKVMPTFHPAYLLRDPSKKREVWEDMKKVRAELDS
jgi:DNA polymerase